MQPEQYSLPAAVTMKTVETIAAEVAPMLSPGAPLVLNAESVDRVDGVGLQLLWVLLAQQGKDKQARITSPSDTLVQAARIFGLELSPDAPESSGSVGE